MRSLRPGFSLVEVLVAVVVVGILAALILPRVQAQRDASRYQVLTGSAQGVVAELERYYARCQHYPLLAGTPGPRSNSRDAGCADQARLADVLPASFASLGGDGPLSVEYLPGAGGTVVGAPTLSTAQSYGVRVTAAAIPAASCIITLNLEVVAAGPGAWTATATDGSVRETTPRVACSPGT